MAPTAGFMGELPTLIDPFTGQIDSARILQLIEGREPTTPEEEAALLEELMAAATWRRPVIDEPDTPLGRAQSLVYDAIEADDSAERERLLRRALNISEDCVDGWVMLAQETAPDAEEAAELYEAGVAAGERVLGDAAFTELRGQFWARLETRPYMRARQGLALAR